jgi:hypothetical protein
MTSSAPSEGWMERAATDEEVEEVGGESESGSAAVWEEVAGVHRSRRSTLGVASGQEETRRRDDMWRLLPCALRLMSRRITRGEMITQ